VWRSPGLVCWDPGAPLLPQCGTLRSVRFGRLSWVFPALERQIMTNLTRFDPFGDLVRFDPFRGFDDLFRMPRLSAYRALPVEPEMKMDLSEDDNAFYVKAEIPGVKKEDIHVAIDGNEVSITSEMKKETEEKKGETVLRSERYYGRVARAFTLTHAIDELKVEAKYLNGVLTLMLPKKGGPTVKEVTIN
jgi:HSP20 family protein